jgi:hypothetical protein
MLRPAGRAQANETKTVNTRGLFITAAPLMNWGSI